MSRLEKFLWHTAAVAIGAGGGAATALILHGNLPASALAGSVASLLFFVQPWKRSRS